MFTRGGVVNAEIEASMVSKFALSVTVGIVDTARGILRDNSKLWNHERAENGTYKLGRFSFHPYPFARILAYLLSDHTFS